MTIVTATRRTAVPSQRGTVLRLPPHPAAPDPTDFGQSAAGSLLRPARARSTCSAVRAGSRSACAMPASRFSLAPTPTPGPSRRTPPTSADSGYVGDLSDPGRAARAARRLGNRPRRARRRRRAVPAVLTSGAGQAARADPSRRTASPGPAGAAVAIVHARRRAPAPDAVLVENVPDLPSWDDGAVLVRLPGEPGSSRLHGRRADPRLLPVRRPPAPLTPAAHRAARRTADALARVRRMSS